MKTVKAVSSDSELKSNEIRLLTAIGFMSARTGLIEQASKIFESLLILRPQKAFPYVGLALSNLCVGQPERAVAILREQGLRVLPNDIELNFWLAIALHYSGQSGSAIELYGMLKTKNLEASALHGFEKIIRKIVDAEPLVGSRLQAEEPKTHVVQ